MWWRKRKKERRYQAVVRGKVQAVIEQIQKKWVNYLKAREQRWSLTQKKWYCVIFCLVSGGASTIILITTLATPLPSAQVLILPEQIAQPVLPAKPQLSRFHPQEAAVVAQFRHWVDSLSQTGAGRRQLDSLYRLDPDLIDSMLELEILIHHSLNEKTP